MKWGRCVSQLFRAKLKYSSERASSPLEALSLDKTEKSHFSAAAPVYSRPTQQSPPSNSASKGKAALSNAGNGSYTGLVAAGAGKKKQITKIDMDRVTGS